VLLLALAPLLGLACAEPLFLPTGPCLDAFDGPAMATCELPGWADRGYDLVLPDDYDGDTPVPLVLAIHGGGGNKEAAERITCSEGTVDDDSCLFSQAQARGYAVVFPNGSSNRLVRKLRSWNAEGGEDGWRCTGGRACADQVDDIAYFRDLLDDVEGRVAVDPDRVFATGISNGGAMSHRLACELSDRVAAVAPVGGELQLVSTGTCAPEQPVAVLDIHGSEDPCWPYEGGVTDCPIGQKKDAFVGVPQTLAAWSEILGCQGLPTEDALPDTADDGTTTTRQRYPGCTADLVHLRIEGGGHTWPDGWQYMRERTVGRTPRDWGNEVIWDFFDNHGR